MVRTGFRAPLAIAAAAALMAANTNAFTLTITNNCGSSIDVYLRQGGVYTDSVDTLATGASYQKTIGKGFEGNFRNGSSTSATLIEFSTVGDYDLAWYDLSVIPPELAAGHEFCSSLDECKAHSKTGIGYNTPVRITPLANTNGDSCRELNCLADGCEDAYRYPKDDLKTHACALDTDFDMTFCPEGSSAAAATSSQTTAPETESPETVTPEVTTAAPTDAPTEAPAVTSATPAETTTAPVATTAAPATTDVAGSIHAYDDTTGDDADNTATPAPTDAVVGSATPTPTASQKSKFCH